MTAAPRQLTDAQRVELRARLAHHQANPSERGVTVQELRAKLLDAARSTRVPYSLFYVANGEVISVLSCLRQHRGPVARPGAGDA